MSSARVYNKIVREVRNYFKRNRLSRAVIGLSGGLDSSVSAKIMCEAIGAENVFGLIMPEKGITKKQNVEDAVAFASSMNMEFSIVQINDFLRNYERLMWKQNRLAMINLKPRIRSILLYNFANSHRAVVVGTSNKSEIKLGYGTKYGDLAADIMPIADLYKTEVIELANFLEIPEHIIEKAPSAELFKEQTDEDDLGATYEILDKILKSISTRRGLKKFDEELVMKIKRKVRANSHKSKPVPVIKLSGLSGLLL